MNSPALLRIVRPLRRLMADRRARPVTAVAVSVACLASVVAVSLHQTPQPAQVQMRNGTIWAASNQVGELTLLDGVGAEVNARVQVAPNDGRLSVSQAGADGYVVNQRDGAATRVDGKTLRALPLTKLISDPSKLIRDPSKLIRGPSRNTFTKRDRLLVGRAAVYQLDPADGLVAQADAQSLVPRGSPIQVAPESKGIATGDGLVWLLDSHTGELRRYGDRAQAPAQYRARPTGAKDLVNVAQRPVLLDYQSGSATLVDPQTGDPAATLAAELTEHDIAWGSDETQRLVIVRPQQGAVSVCRFGERTCRAPVYFTNSLTATLGAAIEVDDHVLVPDYDEGTVHIVDLAKMATVARAQLFDPRRRPDKFELLTRDGIAFFNDPDSERAGVIEVDGTVRHIVKYNPAAPKPTGSASSPPTGRPTPSDSPKPKPSRAGSPIPSGPPHLAAGAPPTSGPPRIAPTGEATTGSGSLPAGSRLSPTSSPPPPSALRILRLDFSPSLPEVGEAVTASAVTTGSALRRWQWEWTIRRADTTIVASSQSRQLAHTFDAPGTYDVSLTVRDGAVSDTRSEPLTVAPVVPSPRCGDTITTSVRLRTDLTCPFNSSGLIVGADNIVIDLDGHTIASAGYTLVDSFNGDYNFITAIMDEGGPDGAHRNVTIRNGTLRNFTFGVVLAHSQATNLVNLRVLVSSNTAFARGIDVRGTIGVTLQGGAIQGPAEPIQALGNDDLLISGVSIIGSDEKPYPYLDTNVTGDLTIEHSTLVDFEMVNETDIFNPPARIVIEHSQLTQSFIFLTPLSAKLTDNTFSGGDGVNIFRGGRVEITRNTFDSARGAGVYIDFPSSSQGTDMAISGNTFSNNGHAQREDFWGPSERDFGGTGHNDGLHIDVPSGTDITVSNNRTSGNADYGIEAEPGTVIDGGGNVSSNDPRGCVGVTCA
jgi:PKD repeat protein